MKDLTQGKEWKMILKFALPMLLGNVFQQMYNIVDSIIVGRVIGKEALAAVGASFPIIFILISLVIGFSTGSTIMIAQYFGAKNEENIKKTIDTLNIVLFFSAIVLSVIGIYFSSYIFTFIDLPADAVPQAELYIKIYLTGLIAFFGFNGVSAILRGLGDSKTPLYFMIIATVLNIILDILFVVVFKWGVAGAAIATIVSQGFAFIVAVIYLNRTHKLLRISFRNLNFDKQIFKTSLKIGLPSGFQQTFVAFGMLFLFKFVNGFGTSTAAAYTVAGRIDMIALMPAMNFSMALSTFAGQNIGANKPERVKKGFGAALIMSSMISILVTSIVFLFGRELMSVFTTDTEVIDIGTKYLLIVSSFYVIFSTMFIINGLLRGAGDTLVPMLITLCALWVVRVPLSYILSLEYDAVGIWWGIPAAWFCGMVLTYFYYLSGKWKTKAVVKYDR